MMFAPGDPPAVPITTGSVVLAVFVLVFFLLVLTFLAWYGVRLIADYRRKR